MSTHIESPVSLEAPREARIVRCWRRFKESRKVHKKRYFFGTCLLKLGAFTAFLVVSGLKFDEFIRRPKYVAVCQYVVSDELDLEVNQTNCYVEVDEKQFTCDEEYGESPTSQSYEDSEYSGYGSGDTSDSGYDSGDTSDTGNTGDNSGTADEGSSSEGNSAIPPSRTIRRALSSSRYLQYSESDSYLYSDEADSAKDFANDIKKGYLVFLYIVWILFNIGFRVRSNLYTYRSRILEVIPSYTKTKKLKIALYENLIDICVATALYPFTYPDYGDCFECKMPFMCSITTYAMVNIGFYIVFISIILSMFDNTRRMYIQFLRSVFEYIRCKSGRRNTGVRCCVRYLICCTVVCINLFAVVACIVSIVDYISTVYSLIQLFISIFFYFALFIDGDVRKGQVAPAEQQNSPNYELVVTHRPNNEANPRTEDQRAIQEPPNRNQKRINILKRIFRIATIFWRCGSQ